MNGAAYFDPAKWRFAHASVIGSAHLEKKLPCQDSFICRTLNSATEGEILIAVVADGASTASESERGARLACELLAAQIENLLKCDANTQIKSLSAEFGRHWIEYYQREIAAVAAADGKTARDYASTLIAAVVGKTGAAFYQLGDGAVVWSSGASSEYRFAVAPVEAAYVNMTDFITDEAAAQQLRYSYVAETVSEVILFSDGIFPVAVDYQTNQPHAPFLMPMIAPLRQPAAIDTKNLNDKLAGFLASPKMNEKTDDDKTLILAARTISGAETDSVGAAR